MIDENRTMQLFGYTSDSLSGGSHKKVVVVCEMCSEERIIPMRSVNSRGVLTTLCKSCGQKNRQFGGEDNPNHNYDIDNWVNEHTSKHFCQCGCGEVIKIKRYHYSAGIPKFIFGHSSKGKNNPNWKGGKTTLICKQCGKEYRVKVKDKSTSKFCSRKCMGEWRSINKSGENSCISGKNNPMYGKIGKNSPNYKPKITLICKQCGKEFKVMPSIAHIRHCCNRDCRNKWLSENLLGENNPNYGNGDKIRGDKNYNYNPNITDEDRILGRSYFGYNQWRKDVYRRDNYTCQICGDSTGGNLNAHHIESYNNNPELRTILENGITLCEDCHKDFHHQYGKGNNTQSQFNRFIIRKKYILTTKGMN